MHVVDAIATGETPSARSAAQGLKSLVADRTVVVVLARGDEQVRRTVDENDIELVLDLVKERAKRGLKRTLLSRLGAVEVIEPVRTGQESDAFAGCDGVFDPR